MVNIAEVADDKEVDDSPFPIYSTKPIHGPQKNSACPVECKTNLKHPQCTNSQRKRNCIYSNVSNNIHFLIITAFRSRDPLHPKILGNDLQSS